MKEWCLIHYKLTFTIIIFALIVVSLGFEQFFTVINNRNKLKALEKLIGSGVNPEDAEEIILK